MEVFELVEGKIKPTVHILQIEPFKTMWANDTSPDKTECLKDFAYIDFMCNPRKSNIFYDYDEATRPLKVKKNVYADENYEISPDVLIGVAVYKGELMTASISYEMLDAGMNAAHKIRDFLNDFDPNERSMSGAIILKPADVLKALAGIDAALKSIVKSRNEVHDELNEGSKTRKDRKIGFFEE